MPFDLPIITTTLAGEEGWVAELPNSTPVDRRSAAGDETGRNPAAVFVRALERANNSSQLTTSSRTNAGVASNDRSTIILHSSVNYSSLSFPSQFSQPKTDILELLKNTASQSELGRLTAQVASLSARVEELAHVVNRPTVHTSSGKQFYGGGGPSAFASVGGAIAAVDVKEAANDEARLAALFEAVADDGLTGGPELTDAAIAKLASKDAVLRAAAGRALAVLAPNQAIVLLPPVIDCESNKVTKSMLQASLRAAKI